MDRASGTNKGTDTARLTPSETKHRRPKRRSLYEALQSFRPGKVAPDATVNTRVQTIALACTWKTDKLIAATQPDRTLSRRQFAATRNSERGESC